MISILSRLRKLIPFNVFLIKLLSNDIRTGINYILIDIITEFSKFISQHTYKNRLSIMLQNL